MNDSQLPIPRASSEIACVATQHAITTRLHNHIMQRQGDDAVLVPQAVISMPFLTVKPGDDFLLVSDFKRLQIWNLPQRVCVKKFNFSVISVAFSEDGQLCITGGTELRLWDTVKWESSVIPVEVDAEITAVAISGDKTHVAIGDTDGAIQVYSLPFWQLIRSGRIAADPTDKISRLWLSPDANHLLSSSSDRKISYWDITTGQNITTRKHKSFCWQVFYRDDEPNIVGAKDSDVWIGGFGDDTLHKLDLDFAKYGEILSVAITTDHKRLLLLRHQNRSMKLQNDRYKHSNYSHIRHIQ